MTKGAFLKLLLVIGLVVCGWYVAYTNGGVRIGMVALTTVHLWNADGTNSYGFPRTLDGIHVHGTCTGVHGTATITLRNPDGKQIAGQECPKGTWTLDMAGKVTGTTTETYTMDIEYAHFTGTLDVNVDH
jgi:hypothetical protein